MGRIDLEIRCWAQDLLQRQAAVGDGVSLVVLDLEGSANESSQPHYRWTD